MLRLRPSAITLAPADIEETERRWAQRRAIAAAAAAAASKTAIRASMRDARTSPRPARIVPSPHLRQGPARSRDDAVVFWEPIQSIQPSHATHDNSEAAAKFEPLQKNSTSAYLRCDDFSTSLHSPSDMCVRFSSQLNIQDDRGPVGQHCSNLRSSRHPLRPLEGGFLPNVSSFQSAQNLDTGEGHSESINPFQSNGNEFESNYVHSAVPPSSRKFAHRIKHNGSFFPAREDNGSWTCLEMDADIQHKQNAVSGEKSLPKMPGAWPDDAQSKASERPQGNETSEIMIRPGTMRTQSYSTPNLHANPSGHLATSPLTSHNKLQVPDSGVSVGAVYSPQSLRSLGAHTRSSERIVSAALRNATSPLEMLERNAAQLARNAGSCQASHDDSNPSQAKRSLQALISPSRMPRRRDPERTAFLKLDGEPQKHGNPESQPQMIPMEILPRSEPRALSKSARTRRRSLSLEDSPNFAKTEIQYELPRQRKFEHQPYGSQHPADPWYPFQNPVEGEIAQSAQLNPRSHQDGLPLSSPYAADASKELLRNTIAIESVAPGNPNDSGVEQRSMTAVRSPDLRVKLTGAPSRPNQIVSRRRIPQWQRNQENSSNEEVRALETELAVERAAMEAREDCGEIMDETPPPVGRFEKRLRNHT